jgi:hypothetical protein
VVTNERIPLAPGEYKPDAAKHPLMHRTDVYPHHYPQQDLTAQNVSSAEDGNREMSNGKIMADSSPFCLGEAWSHFW